MGLVREAKIDLEEQNLTILSDDEEDDEDDYEEENLDDCVPYVTRQMNAEEYAQYCKQVVQSKGFDVERFEGKLPGGIVPVSIDGTKEHTMIDLSKRALQLYNEQNNVAFEFERLVKATHQSVAGTMFYITFAAVSGNKSHTFRGKVWEKLPHLRLEPEVKFCEMI